MIIHNVEQNTDEWFSVRAGIPTASSFDNIITPKGDESKSHYPYQRILLFELVTGKPYPEGYKNKAMEQGHEREDFAAQIYSAITKMPVEKVGFITDNNRMMGCSPDRLVGEDGLLEIKCPEGKAFIEYILEDSVNGAGDRKMELLQREYYPQLQGQLLVTGRKWVDIISYDPDAKPHIVRVRRDEVYLASLRRCLANFNATFEERKRKLVARGYTLHDFSQPEVITPLDAC